MIDPTVEQLIDLREVSRICGRNGKALNPSTIWRWCLEGRGLNKDKLEVIRVGGRVCTSREALARFLAALNPTAAVTSTRTPARRRRASEKAGKQLEQMGV